jgi:hypothetical protein
VKRLIDDAVATAKAAPETPADELTRDIYSGKYPPPRMCNA